MVGSLKVVGVQVLFRERRERRNSGVRGCSVRGWVRMIAVKGEVLSSELHCMIDKPDGAS